MSETPARDEAQRTIRNRSLIGLLNLTLSGLLLTLADSRAAHLCGWFLTIGGAFLVVPVLVAHGIKLERESRESL